ncbi:DMT family transporter [Cypionkella sp.]|uniref:DMT family transporter n=1 Tax=Cypionkella sp. TaxID=2811411 RepID=UPI0026303AB0|nr:DMT family transporter [Cypionkella sp.]MDB5664503.1 EamA/RhaT family transporter [Cypionkella sp.]
MQSLLLGLCAAFLWGLHDFNVRKIGAKTDAAALYLIVLLVGAILLLPLAIIAGGWSTLNSHVIGLSLAAGLGEAVAGYGLYRAFAIGPVRLVAPICGSFPLLSVGFAVARGAEAGPLVWLGAAAVVGGIAIVARGEDDAPTGDTRAAVGWSLLACVSFAATFGLLQWAAEQGADLPVSLVARLAACVAMFAWILHQRIDIKPTYAILPNLALLGFLDVTALTAVTIAAGFARPEFASVASSIFGLVTILLAWRFLGEALKPLQWLGALVVFAGIAVLGLV